LPEGVVNAFKQHPDWGEGWKAKMVKRYEADPNVSPGKPELQVDVTMSASEAQMVRELLAEKGKKLPDHPLFADQEEQPSSAIQGPVGVGGKVVKKKD
jgi:hypothetical protein